MATKDQISSTEKLLELIREKGDDQGRTDSPVHSPTSVISRKSPLLPPISFKKKVTIGIEIGYTHIYMAKITGFSDKSYELDNFFNIPIPDIDSLYSPELPKVIRDNILKLTGSDDRVDIWCTSTSKKVETRCIRIPKVAKKQISNAVYWTFTKEVQFDENNMLLDYQILGDFIEDGIKKTQVMTFTIPKKETGALKTLFSKAGFSLTGISIVPFAIQNLLRSKIVRTDKEDACFLFIGRDWSRITIYSNGNLILSRGIKAGMRSMIDAIAQNIRSDENVDGVFSDPDSESETGLLMDAELLESAEKRFFQFINTNGFKSNDPLSAESKATLETIMPPVTRLIKQVERTIEHYCINFNRNHVSLVFISGKITGCKPVISHMGNELNLPIKILDPFLKQSPFTAKINIPETASRRESYVPAIGIGLSDNDLTPNFLYTQDHREIDRKSKSINISVFLICILFLLLMLGSYFHQENAITSSKATLQQLSNQLSTYSIPADKNLMLDLFAKAEQKRLITNKTGQRYMGSAIINETIHLLPDNFSLLDLQVDLAGISKNRIRKDQSKILFLEGIIKSDPLNFESDLAGFLLRMGASSFFHRPLVKKKQVEFYNNKQVMRFSAVFEIL